MYQLLFGITLQNHCEWDEELIQDGGRLVVLRQNVKSTMWKIGIGIFYIILTVLSNETNFIFYSISLSFVSKRLVSPRWSKKKYAAFRYELYGTVSVFKWEIGFTWWVKLYSGLSTDFARGYPRTGLRNFSTGLVQNLWGYNVVEYTTLESGIQWRWY
jgi:hypothetical protein